MATFRSVMRYAAGRGYIRETQVFRGRLPVGHARREEFTPAEYRKLHSFARSWIKKGNTGNSRWYRQIAYNFILVIDLTPSYRSSLYKTGWLMKEVIDAKEEAFSRRDHQQAS